MATFHHQKTNHYLKVYLLALITIGVLLLSTACKQQPEPAEVTPTNEATPIVATDEEIAVTEEVDSTVAEEPVLQSQIELPPDPETTDKFKEDFLQALKKPRDYPSLVDYMGVSFEIMTWKGDSEQMTPSEAVEALQNTFLPPENIISFDEVDFNMLLSSDPYQLYPDARDFIFTQGWGTTGEDEVILIFKEQDNGSLYWSGILYANGRFAAQSIAETDISWQAPSTESCQDIQALLESTFGLTDTSLSNLGNYECIISLIGNAVDLPETKEAVFAQLQAALEQEGWSIDPQYEASGPNYQNGGFRHDEQSLVMLAYVAWGASADAACPTSQPLSDCEITLEQKLFTITLRVTEVVD